MSGDCEYAKSDMTPCVRRHGESARADDGKCVGCGYAIDTRAPDTQLSEAVRRVEAVADGKTSSWTEDRIAIRIVLDELKRFRREARANAEWAKNAEAEVDALRAQLEP